MPDDRMDLLPDLCGLDPASLKQFLRDIDEGFWTFSPVTSSFLQSLSDLNEVKNYAVQRYITAP